jgi:DeoR family transcriptional regulator, suf operon transcriptional repressor
VQHQSERPVIVLSKQFFETSRGRIVALLKEGESTVETIASSMGVTPNAVRAQLTGMERDGLVRRAGRKRTGASKPSHLFELTPEVEQLLSRAYVPFLTHLFHVLTNQQTASQVNKLMREVGRGLAAELTGAKRRAAGSLSDRVQVASQLLNEELGAVTRVVKENGGFVIRGVGCPLSAITGKHRPVCLAIESLLKETIGVGVHECCDRSDRPRCCFHVPGEPRPTNPHRSR